MSTSPLLTRIDNNLSRRPVWQRKAILALWAMTVGTVIFIAMTAAGETVIHATLSR